MDNSVLHRLGRSGDFLWKGLNTYICNFKASTMMLQTTGPKWWSVRALLPLCKWVKSLGEIKVQGREERHLEWEKSLRMRQARVKLHSRNRALPQFSEIKPMVWCIEINNHCGCNKLLTTFTLGNKFVMTITCWQKNSYSWWLFGNRIDF